MVNSLPKEEMQMEERLKAAARRITSTWRLGPSPEWVEVKMADLQQVMDAIATEDQKKEGVLWISAPPATGH